MRFLNLKLSLIFIVLYFLLSFCLVFGENLKIVATYNYLGWIAKQIGGDKVDVQVIVPPQQDPHNVIPKPAMIVALKRANVLILNGLSLEAAFLPSLLNIAGNRNIDPQTPGFIDCSNFIPIILEKPDSPKFVSSDIHPYGNPHYILDPRNSLYIAQGIHQKLIVLKPDYKPYFDQNFSKFKKEFDTHIKDLQEKIAPLKGKRFIAYHKLFEYFAYFGDFKIVDYLEPNPGIPPTPTQIDKIIKICNDKNNQINAILSTVYFEKKTPTRISQITGIPVIILPHDINSIQGIETLWQLYEYITDSLLKTVYPKENNNQKTVK